MQRCLTMISKNSEMKGILDKISKQFFSKQKQFFPDSNGPFDSKLTI